MLFGITQERQQYQLNMYTQDQINVLEQSYQEEVKKLLMVKGNYALAILNIKTQLSEKDKKISELEKKILDLTPKKKK